MQFSFIHNHCQGWYQALAFNDDGSPALDDDGQQRKSAVFTEKKDVLAAIRHCYQTGRFPIEEEKVPVEVCSACGQPIDDE